MRSLARTTTGMVHYESCHMAQRGHSRPWYWADDVSDLELLDTVVVLDYRECRRCRPLATIRRRFGKQ